MSVEEVEAVHQSVTASGLLRPDAIALHRAFEDDPRREHSLGTWRRLCSGEPSLVKTAVLRGLYRGVRVAHEQIADEEPTSPLPVASESQRDSKINWKERFLRRVLLSHGARHRALHSEIATLQGHVQSHRALVQSLTAEGIAAIEALETRGVRRLDAVAILHDCGGDIELAERCADEQREYEASELQEVALDVDAAGMDKLQRAHELISALSMRDLGELRALSRPPTLVQAVMSAAGLLLEVLPWSGGNPWSDWQVIKRHLLANPQNVCRAVMSLNIQALMDGQKGILLKVQKLVESACDDGAFDEHRLRMKSHAGHAFGSWVNAVLAITSQRARHAGDLASHRRRLLAKFRADWVVAMQRALMDGAD